LRERAKNGGDERNKRPQNRRTTTIDDNYTFEEWLRLWRDNCRRAMKAPATAAALHRREGRLEALEAVYERFVEPVLGKQGAA
jgi:hypothetical protein